jgi:hypothetical protein
MIIQMVVAANGFDGPDFYFCKVDCSQQQYDNGEHYDIAKSAAKDNGYDEPMVPFDRNDPPGRSFFDLFEWESATTYTG